jgi:hypothetical protein
MQQSAFIALRWMRQGLGLLTAYALISAAALAMLGATTAGTLLFSVAAATTMLAGGGLLAGVGAAHRRARHALLQHPQGPPRALRRRRLLPGSGAAAVVYLPLLAASVCLATAVRHAAHPAPRTAVAHVLVFACRPDAGGAACQGSWTVAGRSYVSPVDVARQPPLGITLVQIAYNKADPRVLYDISHPAPSAGVFTPSGGVLIPAGLALGLGIAGGRLGVWYDRNCRAPYVGLLRRAARSRRTRAAAAAS